MLKLVVVIFCLLLFMGTYSLAQETHPTKITKTKTAWNTVCPIDGLPVSADAPMVGYNGKLYGFDKPSCAAVFQDDPSIYAVNLNSDGTKFIRKKTINTEEKSK